MDTMAPTEVSLMTHHVVFLDRDTIAPTIEVRRPDFDHQWTEYDRTSADQIAERVKDATIIINNKVALRAETLGQCPNLKMIAIAATGTDIVDLQVECHPEQPTGKLEHFRSHGIGQARHASYTIADGRDVTDGLGLHLGLPALEVAPDGLGYFFVVNGQVGHSMLLLGS